MGGGMEVMRISDDWSTLVVDAWATSLSLSRDPFGLKREHLGRRRYLDDSSRQVLCEPLTTLLAHTHCPRADMASIARSSVLRHLHTAAATKQFASRSTSTFASSGLRTSRPVVPQLSQGALAGSSRIAAFHASGSKAILPALPRMIYPLPRLHHEQIANSQQQRQSRELVGINCYHQPVVKQLSNASIVNDPAPVPSPSPSHGSYHWTFERLISAGLVPLTFAPFIGGSLNPLMDGVLCAALLAHSHIGFESIITDYLPSWRVPKTRALFNWGLRAATVLVGIGLYEFETSKSGQILKDG